MKELIDFALITAMTDVRRKILHGLLRRPSSSSWYIKKFIEPKVIRKLSQDILRHINTILSLSYFSSGFFFRFSNHIEAFD